MNGYFDFKYDLFVNELDENLESSAQLIKNNMKSDILTVETIADEQKSNK